jgi:hypothetical protein
MKKIIPVATGLILIAGFYYLVSTSEPDDKTYRQLDQLIITEYNQLKIDYIQMKITREEYLARLKSLSTKEDDLFNEVRDHKFDDITEYNYWHRGRLKFPGSIKTELDLITKAEKDSL